MTHAVDAEQPTQTSPSGRLGRLLASTAVSITGQGMVTAATPLLAASLTRDPFGVALISAATYSAWLVVGLPAGVLVDRWPRRVTMVASDVFRAVVVGGLAVVAAGGHASLPLLAVVVLLTGGAACFFDPAAQAAIPSIVGRDRQRLAKANSWLWILDMMGRSLIGPPLGAALFAVAASLPFGVNSVTFLISALLLAGLGRLGVPAPDGPRPPLWGEMVDGVRFLWRQVDLRALTFGMATYNLAFNAAYATLVLFAQEQLHLSDRGFGLLLATSAVGGLVGGWAAPRLPQSMNIRTVYAMGLALQGIGWLVIVTLSTPATSGAALALIGFASMTVTVVGGTARQSLTPDGLLGRVSSSTRVVGIGSAAVGALLGGSLARATSLTATIAAAAVVCLLGAVAYLTAAARLR